MASQLQKLAVIEIDGQQYDLAANGHGVLVNYNGPSDAYTGQPTAKIVNLEDWTNQDASVRVSRVQALLDLLTTAYRQLQSARDSKLGVGREKEGG